MEKNKIENTLRKDIAKPEFWIGLITVFLIIGFVGFITAKEVRKYQASNQQKQKIISPIPLADNNISKKVEITPTPTPKKEPKLAQIKKLADTDITIIAQSNDTFWSISQRYCNDGQYFSTIERLNGYGFSKLQAGDKIIVYCY